MFEFNIYATKRLFDMGNGIIDTLEIPYVWNSVDIQDIYNGLISLNSDLMGRTKLVCHNNYICVRDNILNLVDGEAHKFVGIYKH